MPNEKRKPTWTLCINENPPHEKPKWVEIGAAWDTQGGNLFVKLNEGERLSGTAMLFPYREKRESRYAVRTWRPAVPASAPAATASGDDYMDKKRQERRSTPSAAANPPPAASPSDMDPDPPSPDWL